MRIERRSPTGPVEEHAWEADEIYRLNGLWLAGDSIETIGKKMGRTKNSVTGKVNRLRADEGEGKWPVRGSPIKPAGSGKNPGRRKRPPIKSSTLPPLASLA